MTNRLGPPDDGATPQHVEVLLQLRRWDEAARVASQLVATRPDDAGLRVLQARAFHGGGRDEEAVAAARAARAAAPDWDEPLRIEAWALASRSLREAVVCAREAARRNPDRAANWTTVAILVSRTGRESLAEARHAAEMARRLAPGWAESMNASGIVALRARFYPEAEEWFLAGLAIDPNNSDLLNNLALALTGQGRLDESVGLHERNLANSPRSNQSRRNLGAVVSRQVWRSGPWQLLLSGLVVALLSSQGGSGGVVWVGLGMVGAGFGWALAKRRRLSEAHRSAMKDYGRHVRREHEAKSRFGAKGKWILVGLIAALSVFLVVWGRTHSQPSSRPPCTSAIVSHSGGAVDSVPC